MITKKKFRILFIIDTLTNGGKERQLWALIQGLRKDSNVKIGVVTFNKNTFYYDQVRENVDFFRVLGKRPTRLEPLFTIWKCFVLFKPEIIHTWDSLSSFYGYLPSRIFGLKFIDGSIRDAGIEKGWQRRFKLFFHKRADKIIANSYAGLKKYNAKGIVVYNAIDRQRFLRNEDNGEFNLIMTANFIDYKDHMTLLRAVAELVPKSIVNNVYLLGDGPNRASCQRWVADHCANIRDQIHFLGVTKNVEEYLAKCKIGVLCSTLKYAEGVSNSVLEYMAGGLVPIVTDVGGGKEIISNGVNGYLVPAGDEQAIITIVKLLESNPELLKQLAMNAKMTIRDKFDYHCNIDCYRTNYLSLLQS